MTDHATGRRRWRWVAAAALIAAAGVLAVTALAPSDQQRPLFVYPPPHEIVVPARLAPADAVPAARGELAGSNVLLVTFDTTRADHIGCYGHDDVDTPAIDRLASEGVLFARAYAPAPVTLPSHSTMMTGLYPFHHGARTNTMGLLRDDNLTMAEILSGAGYRTGAVISAFVLDSRFGIAQGFDDYDDDIGGIDEATLTRMVQRPGDLTTDRALAWLRGAAGGPFFLWVHYFDPHQPYEAPEPFAERYGHPYDGEISFADSQLARLLDLVDELGLASRTLVVLAGDHGQGLGEHEEASHGSLLFDTTLHVPLVMRCGDRLGGGVHVDRPVILADILPTVLSLLGVACPAGLDGVDLTRPPAAEARVIYAETLESLAAFGWASLLAVRAGPHKYVWGPRPELYDVAADPFEQRDLIGSQPRIAEDLRGSLTAFFGPDLAQAASPEATYQLTDDEVAKLQALGYLGEGGPAELPPPAERPNPRDAFAVMTKVNAIAASETSIGLDKVIRGLEVLAAEYPQVAVAHDMLGRALLRKGDYERAEQVLTRSLELRPNDPVLRLQLARVNLGRRKVDEAIGLLQTILDRFPKHFETLELLGSVLLRNAEYEQGVAYLQRALAVRPRDRSLPDQLAEAMTTLDRPDDAVAVFAGHLDAEPNLPYQRNAMARLLADGGRYEEAIGALRDGLSLDPGQHELAHNLAVLLLTCPVPMRRPLEAAALLEQACDETGRQDPRFLRALGEAYAQLERLDEAIAVTEEAHNVAVASDRLEYRRLLPGIQRTLIEYRSARDGAAADEPLNGGDQS